MTTLQWRRRYGYLFKLADRAASKAMKTKSKAKRKKWWHVYETSINLIADPEEVCEQTVAR